MNTLDLVGRRVNPKSPPTPKKLPELPLIGRRYGYPVPINIVLKAIVDRQFQINSQRMKGE